ncbi:hypothetical protein [Phycisphaera mikurensis]|uniref:Uncharacterized protein n=1 Tax=Phycisphaera mikurensis (strain NBRC 102666 / KCTC 22515 / FYK2301M01) TaxID=1142394 RepID=I0IDS5_PHYMF|nr:hypothetical protein [Phycisphaera mikurensis]MBB6441225.1 hypothetical protein [Phycisphaera mikurensis]BAM03413.1 hypothetical protein PSMK_12540 [Phycisphaera mikurensis NBRC 102666]
MKPTRSLLNPSLRLFVSLSLALCGAAGAPASAQVGSSIVLAPWQGTSPLELSGQTALYSTDADAPGGASVELGSYSFQGRVRPDLEDEKKLTFGFEFDRIELDTADPVLPERLTLGAAAVGLGLGRFDAAGFGWEWGATAGAGVASSDPFGDEDGSYGVGSLFAVTRPDPQSLLVVALDYDGNRTVFPDVPLPAITYTRFFSEDFSASVGVPFLGVKWTPGRWDLSAGIFLIQARARAAYALTEHVSLYAQYGSRTEAFHVDGTDEHRRLFYSVESVSAGAELDLVENLNLNASVGYAFNHAFESGFDARDLETVRDLDPGVFFGISLGLDF